MDNDTPEDRAGKNKSFRDLRTEAGLPPEKRSDGIEGLLHGGPMQDMEQIMEIMRRKAEKQTAEAEAIRSLLEGLPAEGGTATPSPTNLIHFPQRAANEENG